MMESLWWTLLTIGGPLVIAAVIIYALMNRRRLTHREKTEQHHAVEKLYEDTPEQRARRERDARHNEVP